MKVLIAGAGPTGLTLAIDLARRGVAVRIVEKATEFFEGSRGDSIQPRTLEVFDDLGVLPAVLEAGIPITPFRVYLNGEFVLERYMFEPVEPTPAVPYPNPWMLGQAQLEGLLRARLAEFGASVELGTALVGLTQDENCVRSTLFTGEVVESDYLVGADGGGSTVRKAAGIAFPGTTDETFRLMLGDVRAPSLDHASGHWFASNDDPMKGVGLTPIAGGELFQLVSQLGTGDDASLATMQAVLDGFGAGVELTGCTWSTVWRPNVRLAEHYRVGRVFIAGDAAHVHPPTGGQGMNTGVQDAYNLGWKLASGTDLDSYETERRAVAADVLGVSTRLLEKYTDGHEDAHRRGSESTGIAITYRLMGDDEGLAPGDRAPDAPVVDVDGAGLRLFDLFRGPHPTTLTFGAPAASGENAWTVLPSGAIARAKNEVVDVGGHAFRAYGADGAGAGRTVVIRPDGYVRSIS